MRFDLGDCMEGGSLQSGLERLFGGLLSARVAWKRGSLSVKNAQLQSRWLDDLNIPLSLTASHIGHIRVEGQKTGGKNPVEIRANDIFIILGPRHPNDYDCDSEASLRHARKARHRHLNRISNGLVPKHLDGVCGQSSSPRGLSDEWHCQFFFELLKNALLDLQNVHVRFEDPVTNPRFLFSCGLMIKQCLVSDSPMVKQPLDSFADVWSKQVVMCTSFSWQSYESELIANRCSTDSDWKGAMMNKNMGKKVGAASRPEHLVLPNTEFKINLSCPCHRTSANMSIHIAVPMFIPRLTQCMVSDLAFLVDVYHHWKLWLQQSLEVGHRFKAFAPEKPVASHRAAWWGYAIRSIMTVQRECNIMRHWAGKEAQARLRTHRAYLDLVEQEIFEIEAAVKESRNVKVDEGVLAALEQVENVLPLDLLELWRRQAGGHASIAECDLNLLGVRRRSPDAGVAPTPERECVVSIESKIMGVALVETAAVHPLRQVPFEIVSHRSYTTNYQGIAYPARHPVLGHPLQNLDRFPGKTCALEWQSPGEAPWCFLGSVKNARSGINAEVREFEVMFHVVKLSARLADAAPFEFIASVQRCHAGRPHLQHLVGPCNTQLGSLPLLQSRETSQTPQALDVELKIDDTKLAASGKFRLGHWIWTFSPEAVSDIVFFFGDVFLPRPGAQIYRLQYQKYALSLPVQRAASCSRWLCLQARFLPEISLSMSRMEVCMSGCDPAGDGVFSIAAELRNVEIEPNREQKDDTPQLCPCTKVSFLGILSCPTSGRSFVTGDEIEDFACSDKIISVTAGRMLSKCGECRVECLITWPLCEISTSAPLSLEVQVPYWEMNLEEGYTLTMMKHVTSRVISALPLQRRRCVLGTRMKLWYPPQHSKTQQRRTMRKDSASISGSSGDEEELREIRGHWSCDMWGELLEDGMLEFYSHPLHLVPLYSVRPLEIRSAMGDTAKKTRSNAAFARGAREMEILIPRLKSKTGAAPKSADGTAWIYLNCHDSLSQHWVYAWRELVKLHGESKIFGGLPPRPPPMLWISPWPWKLSCTMQRGQVMVTTAFEVPIRSRCIGAHVSVCCSTWDFKCSVASLSIENEEYVSPDARRFVLAPLPTDAEDFAMSLSLSLAHGGHLRLPPLRFCVDPVLLRRLVNSINAVTDIDSGSTKLLPHWVRWPGSVQLSPKYARSIQEQAFEFVASAPMTKLTCVQSFTSLVVGTWILGGLQLRAASQTSCTFRRRSISGSIGSASVCGASAQSVLNIPMAIPASPSEHAVTAEGDGQVVTEEVPFFELACVREAETKNVGGETHEIESWSISGGTVGPWIVDYHHHDCHRMKEFVVDCSRALTRRYGPSVASSSPKAACGNCRRPCVVLRCADIELHLPTVCIAAAPLAGGSQVAEIALGRIRVRSKPGDTDNQDGLGDASDAQPLSCILNLSWTDFMAANLTCYEGTSPTMLSAGVELRVDAEAELPVERERSKAPRQLRVQVSAPDVLLVNMTDAFMKTLVAHVHLPEAVCNAPSIPYVPSQHRSFNSEYIWSEMLQWNLQTEVKCAGLRLEFADCMNIVHVTVNVLQLQYHYDHVGMTSIDDETVVWRPGGFDFSLETVSACSTKRRLGCDEWGEETDVLRFMRKPDVEYDVRGVMNKASSDHNANEQCIEIRSPVDVREVHILLGDPLLRIDPVLLASFWPSDASEHVRVRAASSTSALRKRLLLAKRKAQGMAAALDVWLVPELLPSDGDDAGKVLSNRTMPQGSVHAPAIALLAIQVDCGEFSVHLLHPAAGTAFQISVRPALFVNMELSKVGWLASYKLDAQQCSFLCGKRSLVAPFGAYISVGHRVQHVQHELRSAEIKDEDSPIRTRPNNLAHVDQVVMTLCTEDIIKMREWYNLLSPRKERATHMLKLSKDSNSPNGDHGASVSGGIVQVIGELKFSFGGLTCILKDGQKLAYKFVLQITRADPGLQPSGLSQDGQLTDSQRLRIVAGFEAWHCWAQVWESLIEPSEVFVVLCGASHAAGQQIASLHCPSIRACVKLSQLREGLQCCRSLLNQLSLVPSGGSACEDGDPQSDDIADPDLLHDFEVELDELSPEVLFNDLDGLPLRLCNDTGCVMLLTILRKPTRNVPFDFLQDQQGDSQSDGKDRPNRGKDVTMGPLRLDSGGEMSLGCVGAIHAAEVSLQMKSKQNVLIESSFAKVQMGCSIPVARAFDVGWSNSLLWQEVSLDAGVVSCRLRSPITVSNQTPLVFDILYDQSVAPLRASPGSIAGICLAHAHIVRDIRIRISPPTVCDWSRPISLQTLSGYGMVVRCSTSCEVVVEVISCGGYPVVDLSDMKDRVEIVLSPRCTVHNALPIPLHVRLFSETLPDAAIPSPSCNSVLNDDAPMAIPCSSFELAPSVTVAAMAVKLGGSQLRISVAQPGKNVWSPERNVFAKGNERTSTVLTLPVGDIDTSNGGRDSNRGGSDENTVLQLEVRCVSAVNGRSLGPRVIVCICASCIVVSHFPMPLRVSVKLEDAGSRKFIMPMRDQGKELWILTGQKFYLHDPEDDAAPACVILDDVPDPGCFVNVRVGRLGAAITRAESITSPPVDIGIGHLVIVPRLWIMNHLEVSMEVQQSGGLYPIVVHALTGSVFELCGPDPPLLLFRCSSGDGTVFTWSGAVDASKEHRCTLELYDELKKPVGITCVDVVQQWTGQFSVHLSAADGADFHIENHTHTTLKVLQPGFESRIVQVAPWRAIPFSWLEPAEVVKISGKCGVLQLQSEQWGASDWMVIDPFLLDRHSTTYGGFTLHAHARTNNGTRIISVSVHQMANVSKPAADAHVGVTRSLSWHLRLSCSELSLSVIGIQSELFRLTAIGLTAGEDCLQDTKVVACSIDALKIDHLVRNARLPTVLRMASDGQRPCIGVNIFKRFDSWATNANTPQIAASSVQELNIIGSEPPLVVECVDIHVSDTSVQVHSCDLVASILLVVQAVRDGMSARHIGTTWVVNGNTLSMGGSSRAPSQLSTAAFNTDCEPPSRLAPHIHICGLRLSPLTVHLQVSSDELDVGSFEAFGPSAGITKKIFDLIAWKQVHDVHVTTEELTANDIGGNLMSILELLRTHYIYSACFQALDMMHRSRDGQRCSDRMLQSVFGAPTLSRMNESRISSVESAHDESSPQVLGCSGHGHAWMLGGISHGRLRRVERLSHFVGKSIALITLNQEAANLNDDDWPASSDQEAHAAARLSGDKQGGDLGCWRLDSMPRPDLLQCNVHEGDGSVAEQPVSRASVEAQRIGGAMYDLVVKPLASMLRISPSTPQASAQGTSVEKLDHALAEAMPAPILLRGPHRLVQKLCAQNTRLWRLLDKLAVELGSDACYEDHVMSLDPDRVIVLTDAYLVVVRLTSCHVERRWALDGLSPSSTRAEGHAVLFTAEAGDAGDFEFSIGSGQVRCSSAVAATSFAISLRRVAEEAQFRQPWKLTGDSTGPLRESSTLVSL